MPALTPVLLAVVLVTHAGTAEPTEPDAQRKARASEHLKRGAELIDAEDLPAALAEFEKAYGLVQSPNILHNFGIVYQGLGRKAAALDAFERFLSDASKAPPAAREHAQKAVQTLRLEVAELRVQADLPGATIFVDGRNVGQTPQERAIYLEPGPHQLTVEIGDRGAVHSEILEFSAGKRLTVPVRLAQAGPPEAMADLKQSGAAPEPSGRTWQRPAAWATAAGAALATGLFGSQLLLRYIHFKEFNDLGCGTGLPNRGGDDCQDVLEAG